jgi:hypothetical protein
MEPNRTWYLEVAGVLVIALSFAVLVWLYLEAVRYAPGLNVSSKKRATRRRDGSVIGVGLGPANNPRGVRLAAVTAVFQHHSGAQS